MISTLKSETARINGAKSRGPVTLEGREKSSRNALKHGLTAGDGMLLLDCEDPAEFQEFLRKLRDVHSPATPAEEEALDEMAKARWRLLRMETIEVGLLNAEFAAQQSKSEATPRAHLAAAFRSLADDSRALALASRYEARLQRQYDRAYKILRELQQAREAAEPEEPREIRVCWVRDPENLEPERELRNEPTDAANKELSFNRLPPDTLD